MRVITGSQLSDLRAAVSANREDGSKTSPGFRWFLLQTLHEKLKHYPTVLKTPREQGGPRDKHTWSVQPCLTAP